MTIGVFERGGLFLCPRLLDGAVPIWRATRGACCTYCVQCCVHGSSGTFDSGEWCSLGSCFCSIDVESTLGHVINSKQSPCAPTRKISHTHGHAQREIECARPRLRARETVTYDTTTERKYRKHRVNHEPKTMHNGDNAQWSMQMSIQVASAKDAHSGTLRARTQAHTTTHRETTHTDRTDHSHRARATTKLRGVTRRASYAVRAA